MTITWFLDDEKFIYDELNSFISFSRDGKKISIRDEEVVKLIISDAVLKFGIGKYDKITLSLNKEDSLQLKDFLLNIDDKIIHKLNNNLLNIKLNKFQISDFVEKKVTAGCKLQVKLLFNGVWKMDGKLYPSFLLQTYDIVKKLEKQ